MNDFLGTVLCIMAVSMISLGFAVGKASIGNDCDRLGTFYLQGTTYSCKPVETDE